jgi:flavorubredoxin
MIGSYNIGHDIDVLASSVPLPGLGQVPVNAFVIKGPEPILVDTGVAIEQEAFMGTLQSVIDPADLRWLWLTHTDFDHIGCLNRLLADNPRLRVVTTFLGMGIMGLASPLPVDRVRFVNPGERVTLGNRTLQAVKPPVFDNPCTTGFYDEKSAAFFSSDCFGAALSTVPQSAADIGEQDLRDGQIRWATIDTPWLHKVDRGALERELEQIRAMAPALVLSSHLPPAPGRMIDRLLAALAATPGAQPFVGPNQAAFEQMLKKMAEVA